MSHFGRSGPPDIKDTYSLLVHNLSFETSADDLLPLFDKYGKVIDIFIPKGRRTGESRGFGFVRYKHADEAERAKDRLDGREVDGRMIIVQFAKYGPNAEPIKKGRIVEVLPRSRGRSRSRSPRRRYPDDYRDYRRRSRSLSQGRYERDRYHGRDFRRRSRSVSEIPDRYHGRDYRRRSRIVSESPDRYHGRDYHRRSRSVSESPDYHRVRGRGKNRSHSFDSRSPVRSSPSPSKSPPPCRTQPSRDGSPDRRRNGQRYPSMSVLARRRHSYSHSPTTPVC